MSISTFLSYSRKDLATALLIQEKLEKYEIPIWIDHEEIEIGTTWRQEIQVAIQTCSNFIVLYSENYQGSPVCDWELKQALSHNKRIIPIALPGFKGFSNVTISVLSELNFLYLNLQEFQSGIQRLVQSLQAPWGVMPESSLNAFLTIGEQKFPLLRKKYFLGRYPNASWEQAGLIFLKGAGVSRHHASLTKLKQCWIFQDESSKNGSLVNEQKLTACGLKPLKHGDKIALGGSTLLYQEIKQEASSIATDSEAFKTTVW